MKIGIKQVLQGILATFGYVREFEAAPTLNTLKSLPLRRYYNGFRPWVGLAIARVSRSIVMAPNAGSRFNDLSLPFVEVNANPRPGESLLNW